MFTPPLRSPLLPPLSLLLLRVPCVRTGGFFCGIFLTGFKTEMDRIWADGKKNYAKLKKLGILIENMRREGYEFCVSPPRVLTTEDEEGNKLEPVEEVREREP